MSQLIVEYMSLLPKRRLKSIEAKTRYFHAMLEADAAGDLLVNKDDWQGGLNALRRDINELNEIANEETRGLVNKVKGDLTNEILTLQSDMSTALEDIANQIREVRRMQTRMSGTILGAGVQGAGKQVTTAVNTVRMIGSKIPILGPGIEGIANLNFAGGKVLPSAQLLPNAPRGRSESPHRATANRSQNAL